MVSARADEAGRPAGRAVARVGAWRRGRDEEGFRVYKQEQAKLEQAEQAGAAETISAGR